jgi:hypothetical protein
MQLLMTHHHRSLVLSNLCKILLLILYLRLDNLVGSPEDVRNCLTVEPLIPKFTFPGIEPTGFSNFVYSVVLFKRIQNMDKKI